MSPASKKEWAVIAECKTRIEHLEEAVKELKQELRNQKTEKVDTQRYISNRRIAIYIGIASVISSILGGLIVWLLQRIIP